MDTGTPAIPAIVAVPLTLARASQTSRAGLLVTQVVQQGETILANREANVAAGEKGFYVEFTLPEAQAEIVDKLENRRGRFPIELVNVHPADAGFVSATVFVPERQKEYYLRKVAAYRDEDKVREKTLSGGDRAGRSASRSHRQSRSLLSGRADEVCGEAPQTRQDHADLQRQHYHAHVGYAAAADPCRTLSSRFSVLSCGRSALLMGTFETWPVGECPVLDR